MKLSGFSDLIARDTSSDRLEIDLAELRGMEEKRGEFVIVWERPSVAGFHQALSDVPTLAQRLGGWPPETVQDLLTMASAHVGPTIENEEGKPLPDIDLYLKIVKENDAVYYELQRRFVKAFPHICRRELLIGYAQDDAEFAAGLLAGEVTGLKVASKKNLNDSALDGSDSTPEPATTPPTS